MGTASQHTEGPIVAGASAVAVAEQLLAGPSGWTSLPSFDASRVHAHQWLTRARQCSRVAVGCLHSY